MTSIEPGPFGARSTQLLQTPHGVEVGPCSQLSERARIRALDVLPQPRGPERRDMRGAHDRCPEPERGGLNDVILTDDFSQRCWAVFAVQGGLTTPPYVVWLTPVCEFKQQPKNQWPTSDFSHSTARTATTTPAI